MADMEAQMFVDSDDDDDGSDDSDSDFSGDGASDTRDRDELVAQAQAARYPALAMKAYFDTHLHLRASQLSTPTAELSALVTTATTPSASAVPQLGSMSPTASSIGPQTLPAPSVHSSVAVVQASPEQRQSDLDMCLNAFTSNSSQTTPKGKMGKQSITQSWTAIDNFLKLNGTELLVRLAHMLTGQESYTGRSETIVAIFDSLAVCCLEKGVTEAMCQPLLCPRCPDKTSGVIVALEATHSEQASDAAIIKSALSFLTVLCSTAPKESSLENDSPEAPGVFSGSLSTPATSLVFSHPKSTPTTPCAPKLGKKQRSDTPDNNQGGELDESGVVKDETNQRRSNVFECIQMNDGIMRLRDLLFTKTPVTEADAIRMHACRVLLGLVQNDTIRQILSRLSLFMHGQLQQLMKEPVLQDNMPHHIRFCQLASELAEKVSGMRLPTEEEMREQMRKTGIVARTNYRYDKNELLELMYGFLKANSLDEDMKKMLEENSPCLLSRSANFPSLQEMLASLPKKNTTLASKKVRLYRKLVIECVFIFIQAFQQKPSSLILRNTYNGTPRKQTMKPPPPGVPLPPLSIRHSPAGRQLKFLKQERCPTVQVLSENNEELASTVDNIVTAYLKQQHSQCPVPMSICPTFSLLKPHRCPVPLSNALNASYSLPRRIGMSHVKPPWGGGQGRRLNRQFVFSRFQPIRTIRHMESLQFTCCSFLPSVLNGLAIGTDTGDVFVFDSDSGSEVSVFTCHPSPLTHIEFAPWSNSHQLFLTSSTWNPLSALWQMPVPASGMMERDIQPDQKVSLENDNYVEFGHGNQTSNSAPLMIGTQESIAHLYDVSTGQLLYTLFDQERSSGYTYNRAHLDPRDKLVLSDGLLWDVRSKKTIHKFDKLNADISGIFHPSGLEVIINCEVWDLRTYRLLRTVPDLNQCSIVFSGNGEVLYGAVLKSDPDFMANPQTPNRSPFGSMFRTYHADDYTPIASVDVKRTIFDLAIHPLDHTVAIVDNDMNSRDNDGGGDSCARLYSIGLAHPPDNVEASEPDETANDDDDDDDSEEDDDDDDMDLLNDDDDDDSSDSYSSDSSEENFNRRYPLRLGSGSSRGGDIEQSSTRSRGGVVSPPSLSGPLAPTSDMGSPVFGSSSLQQLANSEGSDDDASFFYIYHCF